MISMMIIEGISVLHSPLPVRLYEFNYLINPPFNFRIIDHSEFIPLELQDSWVVLIIGLQGLLLQTLASHSFDLFLILAAALLADNLFFRFLECCDLPTFLFKNLSPSIDWNYIVIYILIDKYINKIWIICFSNKYYKSQFYFIFLKSYHSFFRNQILHFF